RRRTCRCEESHRRKVARESLRESIASAAKPLSLTREGTRELLSSYASARLSRLAVIFCTRSSAPCGRLQWDHGSMWPGGLLRPCGQKMVAALKTKLFLGPGKIVAVQCAGVTPPRQTVPSATTSLPGICAGEPWCS